MPDRVHVPQFLVVQALKPADNPGDPPEVYATATLRDPHPYFFPFRLADLVAADRWLPAGWTLTGSIRGRLT